MEHAVSRLIAQLARPEAKIERPWGVLSHAASGADPGYFPEPPELRALAAVARVPQMTDHVPDKGDEGDSGPAPTVEDEEFYKAKQEVQTMADDPTQAELIALLDEQVLSALNKPLVAPIMRAQFKRDPAPFRADALLSLRAKTGHDDGCQDLSP